MSIRKPGRCLSCVSAWTALLFAPAMVMAGTVSHEEDFSTTTYRAPSTTARWDTTAAVLQLPPFVSSITATQPTTGQPVALSQRGNQLCVATDTWGLTLFNITVPTGPFFTASLAIPGGATDMATEGDYVTISSDGFGVYGVNTSIPHAPALSWSWWHSGQLGGLDVLDDRAYVAAGSLGVAVLDSGSFVTFYSDSVFTAHPALDVALDGTLLYVLTGSGGLTIVDVDDINNMSIVGSYDTAGDTRDIFVENGVAIIADGPAGVLWLSVADPANPTLLSQLPTPQPSERLDVRHGKAFIALQSAGLSVVDMTDPTQPIGVETIATAGPAVAIEMGAEYAYVGTSPSSFQVAHTGNLACPRLLGEAPGSAFAVDIVGTLAYTIDSNLRIFDLSNPATPTLVSSTPLTLSIGKAGVAVRGRFAFVATLLGFEVFDISDPVAPVSVSSRSDHTSPVSLDVEGGIAVLGLFDGTLLIYDVSDPTQVGPPLTTVAEGGTILDIDLQGDFAYAAKGTGGVRVYDLSDPANPIGLSTYSSQGGTTHQVVADGLFAHVLTSYVSTSRYETVSLDNPAGLSRLDSYFIDGDNAVMGVRDDLVYVDANEVLVIDVSWPDDIRVLLDCDEGIGSVFVEPVGANLLTGNLRIFELFDANLDPAKNIGESTVLNPIVHNIGYVKLEATTDPAVQFFVSSNGFADAQEIVSMGSWVQMNHFGNGLQWRAVLTPDDLVPNPTVYSIELSWRYSFPVITSVEDVPDDLGGRVRLRWVRPRYDFGNSSLPTTTAYEVYRGAELVATVPARRQDTYAVVVPTLVDSPTQTSFWIRSLDDSPDYQDSPTASGASVVNRIPNVPQGLQVSMGQPDRLTLSWESPAGDADEIVYRVYRASHAGAGPATWQRVAEVRGTSWSGSPPQNARSLYHVTALFPGGLESEPSLTVEFTPTAAAPQSFALHQNSPNPFNPRTTIEYDVLRAGLVQLQVFDVAGRLRATLVSGPHAPGSYSVDWDGRSSNGAALGSGTYFYRMSAPGYSATRRLMLLK